MERTPRKRPHKTKKAKSSQLRGKHAKQPRDTRVAGGNAYRNLSMANTRREKDLSRRISSLENRRGIGFVPFTDRNVPESVAGFMERGFQDNSHLQGIHSCVRKAKSGLEEVKEQARFMCNTVCRETLRTVQNPFEPHISKPLLDGSSTSNTPDCAVVALTRVTKMEVGTTGYGFIIFCPNSGAADPSLSDAAQPGDYDKYGGPFKDTMSCIASASTYAHSTLPAANHNNSANLYTTGWYNSPYSVAENSESLSYTYVCSGIKVTPTEVITAQKGRIAVKVFSAGTSYSEVASNTFQVFAMSPGAETFTAAGTDVQAVHMSDNTRFGHYVQSTDPSTYKQPTNPGIIIAVDGADPGHKFSVEYVAIYYVRGREVGDSLTPAIHSAAMFNCLSTVYGARDFMKIFNSPSNTDTSEEVDTVSANFWQKVGPYLAYSVEVGLPALMEQLLPLLL